MRLSRALWSVDSPPICAVGRKDSLCLRKKRLNYCCPDTPSRKPKPSHNSRLGAILHHFCTQNMRVSCLGQSTTISVESTPTLVCILSCSPQLLPHLLGLVRPANIRKANVTSLASPVLRNLLSGTGNSLILHEIEHKQVKRGGSK